MWHGLIFTQRKGKFKEDLKLIVTRAGSVVLEFFIKLLSHSSLKILESHSFEFQANTQMSLEPNIIFADVNFESADGITIFIVEVGQKFLTSLANQRKT